MKLDFIPRACPLCGGDDARVLVEATIDEGKLTASAFASRKLPEYMHSRMVECNLCGMLYANPVLRPEALPEPTKKRLLTAERSLLAAVTYRALLEPHLTALPSRRSALDIGAGDGAFVEELLALGFTEVIGVEPSIAPIEAAKPAIRGYLKCGIFRCGAIRSGEPRSHHLLSGDRACLGSGEDSQGCACTVEAGRPVLHCRARPPGILCPHHGHKVTHLRHRAPATLR